MVRARGFEPRASCAHGREAMRFVFTPSHKSPFKVALCRAESHYRKCVSVKALFAKAGVMSCVRTLSKRHLFWSLGLAFERKADAPSYCK